MSNQQHQELHTLLPDLCHLLWILLRESENVFHNLAAKMMSSAALQSQQQQQDHNSGDISVNENDTRKRNNSAGARPAFVPPPRMTVPSEVIVRLVEKSGLFLLTGEQEDYRIEDPHVKKELLQHLHQIRKSVVAERKRPSRLTSSEHIEMLIEKLLFIAVSTSHGNKSCISPSPSNVENNTRNDNKITQLHSHFFIDFFIHHLASTLVIAVSTSTESLWRLSVHDAWERAPTRLLTLDNRSATIPILPVLDLRKELVEHCQLVTTLEEMRVLDSILSCFPSDLVETDFEELVGHFFAESPLFVCSLFREQSNSDRLLMMDKTNNNKSVRMVNKKRPCDEILKQFSEYRLEYLDGEIQHVFDGINKFEVKIAFPKRRNFDNSDEDDDDASHSALKLKKKKSNTKLLASGRKKSAITLIGDDEHDGRTSQNNHEKSNKSSSTLTKDGQDSEGENDDDDIFQDDVSFLAASALIRQRRRNKSISKLETSLKRKISFSQQQQGDGTLGSRRNSFAHVAGGGGDGGSTRRLTRRMSSFGMGGGSNHNGFQFIEEKIDLKTLAWAVRLIVNTISDMGTAGSQQEDEDKKLQVLMQIRLFNDASRLEAWRWLTQQHQAVLKDAKVGLKAAHQQHPDNSNIENPRTDPILEKALGLVALLVTTSDLNSQYLLTSRGKVFAALSKACLLQCERISILKGFAWPPRITREGALTAISFLQAKTTGAAQQPAALMMKNSASQLRNLTSTASNNNTTSNVLLNVNLSPSRRMIGKIVATTESQDLLALENKSPRTRAKEVNEDFILRRVEKMNREMLRNRFQNRIEERRREMEEQLHAQALASSPTALSIDSSPGGANNESASVLSPTSPLSPSSSLKASFVDKNARVFCMITLCSARNVRAACHDAISLMNLIQTSQQHQINNQDSSAADTTSAATESGGATTSLSDDKQQQQPVSPKNLLKNARRRSSVAIDFSSGRPKEKNKKGADSYSSDEDEDTVEKVFDIHFQVAASIQNRAGITLVKSPNVEVPSKTDVIKSNFAAPDDVFCFDPYLSRAVVEVQPKSRDRKRHRSVFAHGGEIFDDKKMAGKEASLKVDASTIGGLKKEDNPFVILKMAESHSSETIARKAWYLPEFPGVENAIGDAHFIAKMDVPLNEANIDLDEEDDEELAAREENGAFMGLNVFWLFEAIPFCPSRKDKCYVRISIEAICLSKNGKDAALKMFEKQERDQEKADVVEASYRPGGDMSMSAFGMQSSNSLSMVIRNEDEAMITESDLSGSSGSDGGVTFASEEQERQQILPLIQTLFSGFGEVSLSVSSRPDEFPVAKIPATSVTARQSLLFDPAGATFVCSLDQHEEISVAAINAESAIDELDILPAIADDDEDSFVPAKSAGILGQFKINTVDLAKRGTGRYCFSISSDDFSNGDQDNDAMDETSEELFKDFYPDEEKARRKRKHDNNNDKKVEAVLILSAIPLTPNFVSEDEDEAAAARRRQVMMSASMLSPSTVPLGDDMKFRNKKVIDLDGGAAADKNVEEAGEAAVVEEKKEVKKDDDEEKKITEKAADVNAKVDEVKEW